MTTLRIGLASPRFPASIADAIRRADEFLAEAARKKVDVVCFPECYIPGMRGQDFPVPPPDQREQANALEAIRAAAQVHAVAAIVPMEWRSADGMQNVAFVISAAGEVLGYQTKNQLPPEEEPYFEPGTVRRLFSVRGVPFGVAICHEGWRYPETVRWAAVRGAKIVFHPNYVGGATPGEHPDSWGMTAAPFYEKAMAARAGENSVYFASVNYALPHQEAATTLVGPEGDCLAYAPYGKESLLTFDIDTDLATGLLAARYQPARYQDAGAPDAAAPSPTSAPTRSRT
jgi:predicted amidohydrolase